MSTAVSDFPFLATPSFSCRQTKNNPPSAFVSVCAESNANFEAYLLGLRPHTGLRCSLPAAALLSCAHNIDLAPMCAISHTRSGTQAQT